MSPRASMCMQRIKWHAVKRAPADVLNKFTTSSPRCSNNNTKRSYSSSTSPHFPWYQPRTVRAFESSHVADVTHKRYTLHKKLLEYGILDQYEIEPAKECALEDILRVHEPRYVEAFINGTISEKEMRRIGIREWSPSLVKRIFTICGASIQAANAALEGGIGINLGGGSHHAHYDFGSGFCVWNDEVVSMRRLLHEQRVSRILVLDLDCHQGDGTAALTANDSPERIFTFNMYGERNFPFRKSTSSWDIALPDETGDAEYIARLRDTLDEIRRNRFPEPDIVYFQSGVDVLKNDRLGRLSLSLEGLAERDRTVFQFVKELEVPLVMTLGGGYQAQVSDVVDAHCQTIRVLKETLC